MMHGCDRFIVAWLLCFTERGKGRGTVRAVAPRASWLPAHQVQRQGIGLSKWDFCLSLTPPQCTWYRHAAVISVRLGRPAARSPVSRHWAFLFASCFLKKNYESIFTNRRQRTRRQDIHNGFDNKMSSSGTFSEYILLSKPLCISCVFRSSWWVRFLSSFFIFNSRR